MKNLFLAVLGFILLSPLVVFSQAFKWAKQAGDNNSYDNYGAGVAIGRQHNTIVAGSFANNCNFGSTTLTTPGGTGGFVARYDSLGGLIWVKAIQGADAIICTAVATDSLDNIYVSGNMHAHAAYFTGTDSLNNWNISGWNGFIAKYDASGNFIWAKATLSYNSDNKTTALTIDRAGNPVLAGTFKGTVTIEENELRGGTANCFIAKFTSGGNLLWCRAGKSNHNCLPGAITCDNAGNVYATGKVSGATAWNVAQRGIVQSDTFNTSAMPTDLTAYLPDITPVFTGKAMKVSGGKGSYSNFLYRTDFSNLEHFRLECTFTVDAGGDGVGLGKYGSLYALAQFPLSVTAPNRFFMYNGVDTFARSAYYNIAAGDSIKISFQRGYDSFSAMLVNYTRHYTLIQGYRYLIGPPISTAIMPNNGFYLLYFAGGAQSIYNFKISSTENYDPLTVFVGNSITTGYYSGGKGGRYQDVTYNTSPYIYATNAGAGDVSANALADTAEIISLHPEYAFMKLGTNDASRGVDTLVYKANVLAMVKAFKAHGIKPVLATLLPISGTIVDAYIRQLRLIAVAETLPVVDFFNALLDPSTGTMKAIYHSGDYVHPSPAGFAKMAATILAEAPFLLSDTAAWNAAHAVTTSTPGNDRVFLIKMDADGNVLWVKLDTSYSAGGSSTSNNFTCGNGIGVDNAGYIYNAGNYLNGIYFSGMYPVTLQDAFIAKYDNTGKDIWHKRFGNNANDGITGLTLNATGEPAVIGNYSGSLRIDTNVLPPAAGYENIFIAQFNSTGVVQKKVATGGYINIGRSVAYDKDGHISITGNFNNAADFGSIHLSSALAPSPVNYNVFAARLSLTVPATAVVRSLRGNSNTSIYPNPATTTLYVSFQKAGLHTIHIKDVNGKILLSATETGALFNVDIRMLASGLYFVTCIEENGVFTGKFIKL